MELRLASRSCPLRAVAACIPELIYSVGVEVRLQRGVGLVRQRREQRLNRGLQPGENAVAELTRLLRLRLRAAGLLAGRARRRRGLRAGLSRLTGLLPVCVVEPVDDLDELVFSSPVSVLLTLVVELPLVLLAPKLSPNGIRVLRVQAIFIM